MPEAEITMPKFSSPVAQEKFEWLTKVLGGIPAPVTNVTKKGNDMTLQADMKGVGEVPIRLTIGINGKSGVGTIEAIEKITADGVQPGSRDLIPIPKDTFLKQACVFADTLKRMSLPKIEAEPEKQQIPVPPTPVTRIPAVTSAVASTPSIPLTAPAVDQDVESPAEAFLTAYAEFRRQYETVPASRDLYGRASTLDGKREIMSFYIPEIDLVEMVDFGLEVRFFGEHSPAEGILRVESVETEFLVPDHSIVDPEHPYDFPETMKPGYDRIRKAVDDLIAKLPEPPKEFITIGVEPSFCRGIEPEQEEAADIKPEPETKPQRVPMSAVPTFRTPAIAKGISH